MKKNINDNDLSLLFFCINNTKSITDIAKALNIAPKNVSVRIKKLEEANLIKVKNLGKGKKILIKSNIPEEIIKELNKFYIIHNRFKKIKGKLILDLIKTENKINSLYNKKYNLINNKPIIDKNEKKEQTR